MNWVVGKNFRQRIKSNITRKFIFPIFLRLSARFVLILCTFNWIDPILYST